MKIVALTGAGISKASGVPTFEEMGDLRQKLSRSYYNTNPEDFFSIVLGIKEKANNAMPNPAHLALAKHHIPIVTMNIDGLHHKAGSSEDEVIEIHGSVRKVFCPRCGHWFDFDIVSEDIHCIYCKNTILQPDIVLYEDSIPRLDSAIALVQGADRLVVIGTSFYTSTASYITEAAKMAGIPVDIINDNAEEKLPLYLEEHGGINGQNYV